MASEWRGGLGGRGGGITLSRGAERENTKGEARNRIMHRAGKKREKINASHVHVQGRAASKVS